MSPAGDVHSWERKDYPSVVEWEEHAHVGGDDSKPGFKYTYSPPMAYKAFPSLMSGYTLHSIAPVGSMSAASVWRAFRETKDTGTIEWANGNAQWVNTIDSLASLPYL